MFKRHSFAVLALLATTTTNPDCSLESAQLPPPPEPACSELSPDIQASNGWHNVEAAQAAEGELFFRYKARPMTSDMDGLLAIGPQRIDIFSDAAILVRFAPDGLVDARNGSIYDSEVAFPYEPGVWYEILVSADLKSQTYSVDIGRCGEQLTNLIANAAFRSDAPNSSRLTHWAAWSSQSATLDVAAASWGATGSCQPATCELMGRQCGSASDGCGGTLSCGGCASGESCSSGTCVVASTPPPGGNNWWDSVEKPDASNTGPSNPGAIRDIGSCPTINSNGTTLENFSCSGRLTVNASNVTLRNFRINVGGGWYGVLVNGSTNGLLMEDGELYSSGGSCASTIRGMGWTGRRLNIHSCDDGLLPDVRDTGTPAGDVEITHSYIHDLDGGHGDGVQTFELANNSLLFQYNTIEGGNTSAFILGDYVAIDQRFRIYNNWLSHNAQNVGGIDGYTIYCNPRVEVYDNLFGRNSGYGPIHDPSRCDVQGNLWSDDFTPVYP